MNRIFKTILLCVLMLSLPVQGIAAATQAACAARHSAKAEMSISGHGGVHGQPREKMYYHDGDVHSHQAALTDHGSADSMKDHERGSVNLHKVSGCSACASCCFGAAAPPPAVSWMPQLAGSHVAVSLVKLHFAAFIPAGLERPPRTFSAQSL